jgi:hypothetical protein
MRSAAPALQCIRPAEIIGVREEKAGAGGWFKYQWIMWSINGTVFAHVNRVTAANARGRESCFERGRYWIVLKDL